MNIKPRIRGTVASLSAIGLFGLGTTVASADEVSLQLIGASAPIATSLSMATMNASLAVAPVAVAGEELLPPNAKPGECYARVWVPPKFQTTTETVETKAASARIEVVPASYETVTERVLVKEASSKLISVPATYGTSTDKVLVKESETHWHYGRNGLGSAQSKNASHPSEAYIGYARSLGMSDAAQAGQCYAEHIQPATYSTVTERMLKTEASQKIQVVPAQYETVEETLLISEASEKLITVPAVYETLTETVMTAPAYTTWQVSECSGGACETGSVPNRVTGSVDRIDRSTGEIMCLVEMPAKYKTVSKRVLKTPATTKTVAIPAQYKTQKVRKLVAPASQKVTEIPETYQTVTKTVKSSEPVTSWHMVGAASAKTAGNKTGNVLCLKEKPAVYKTVARQVVKTPATTKSVQIPEVYKTVNVRKMTAAPQERRIEIPAQYGKVTKTDQISDGEMQWKPVLCQANMTSAKIMEIQKALKSNGSYYGPIDGLIGSQTINAVQKFQKKKGLVTTRFLTIETVKALGVNPTH